MINDKLFDLGIRLSNETNQKELLNNILLIAMEVTACDGATLYTPEGDELYFRITKTISTNSEMGFNGEPVPIPPVPLEEAFVASYVALKKVIVDVKDVYESTVFDFTGPRKYDEMTGYRTKSMLVVPLLDNYKNTIGVLQLINAKDSKGNVVAFPSECQQVVKLLASFSNISLTNMIHSLEMKRQMFSFFDVIITAIDERSSYNATHTMRIVEILLSFLDYIEFNDKAIQVLGEMTPTRKEILVMSAWLHDIGKLTTPLNILDKSSRLEEKELIIKDRLEKIQLLSEVAFLKNKIPKSEYLAIENKIVELKSLVEKINKAGFLKDEIIEKINSFSKLTYIDLDGQEKQWLKQEEIEALTIRKGTLSEKERRIIQNHAIMTGKFLSKMAFSSKYKEVEFFASSHHELLNGKGYPKGLTGDEIPVEVRLLTILDIFEALTTKDRPYKEPMAVEKALSILHEMVKFGEIDGKVLSIFEDSRSWDKPRKMDSYLYNELSLFPSVHEQSHH